MREKIKVFLLYCISFLLFFLRFPLSGTLPGKTDCWWHLATFSDFESRLWAYWYHLPVTTSYFPSKGLWLYGEPSFGVGLIYIVIHSILPNYIWSFYLLFVVLFSFTAFAFYLLTEQFVHARLPRIVGGFFFTIANFSLGHLDHHNTFFWALAFFSILFFYKYLTTRSNYNLYLMFVLWGLQIYFSTTIFVYLSIWIILLFLLYYKDWVGAKPWLHLILGGVICALLMFPLLRIYVFSSEIKSAYNPSLFASGAVVSNLWPSDFLRFLPNNIFYPSESDIDFDLLYNIKCAAPGIILFLLFLAGFKQIPSKLLIVAVVGLILALGSEVRISSWSIPMPMKLYYANLPNLPFLRTPIRAYFLVHWMLCLGAVYGLNRFRGRLRISGILLITGLFFFENVPTKLPSADAAALVAESTHIAKYLSEGVPGSIVHLPSELFPKFPISENPYKMNIIAREYFYSFVQTVYKRNTINGSAGYIPRDRIEINKVLQLQSSIDFKNLLQQYDVKYVILHKDLMLKEESCVWDSIGKYSFLHLERKIDSCYIFSVDHSD